MFFVAFNSRDMTMLWVLNLYSRSSPTKWKRIFDLRSQKFFFDTQSWHVGNFSRNGSMGNVKFESEISMKNVFFIKFFSGLHYNANTFWIIQRMWKVFIVVSRAVNDTSGSAHGIHHSLKLQVIVKFR